MTETPTLTETLAEFQARRAPTMAPEALRINVNQRRLLVETADHAGFVRTGDAVAPFTLQDVDGEELTLDGLLARGPVVLVFFRFAGCPACNIALPYYDRHLAPELARLGATLVGVSPQVPERLKAIRERHGLGFRIASDADNALGRRFGILYSFDEPSRQASIASGTPIGAVTGTGTFELPMPAAIVIGEDRIVHLADVSPDWLVRTEPADILAAVRALPARAPEPA